LIKREDFFRVGGFDENYDLWEDYDLWLRFLSHGKHGRLLRETLFLYRRHLQGRSGRQELRNVKEMMRSLRERNPLAYGLQNITSPSAPGKRLIHRDRMQSEVDIVLDGFAQLYRVSLEKRLRFQEYRRPNIINPLQRRFWSLSTSSSTSRRRVNILYLIPFNAVLGGAEIEIAK
jgi:hypothetical protein